MPLMSSKQLDETAAHVQDIFSRYWVPMVGVSKADVRVLCAAMDQWLDDAFPLVADGDRWNGHPDSYVSDAASEKPAIICAEIDAALDGGPVFAIDSKTLAYAVAEKREKVWPRPDLVEA